MRILAINMQSKPAFAPVKNTSFLGEDTTHSAIRPLSYDVFKKQTNIDKDNQEKELAKKILKIKNMGVKSASSLFSDANLSDRIMLLMTPNENNQVVLIDDADEKTEIVLERPFSAIEIDALLSKSGGISLIRRFDSKIQDFFNLLTTGLTPDVAVDFVPKKELFQKYYELIEANTEDGKKAKFEGRIMPDEAATILLYANRMPSDETLQNFIDLKDTTDLSDMDALYFANKFSLRARLLELINPNEDGTLTLSGDNGEEIVLPRALTSKEAIAALKLSNEKMKFYIQFLDLGLDTETALKTVGTKARLQKFTELMLPNEEGKVVLKNKKGENIPLPRALTFDEARIITGESYNFTPEIIREQLLEFGEIRSRRLTRYLY